MTGIMTMIAILLFIAFVADLNQIRKMEEESMITGEEDDNMDYVELNGELIPYNEDDQE